MNELIYLGIKLNATSYAKTHSNQTVAKRFNVDKRRIRKLKKVKGTCNNLNKERWGVQKELLAVGGRNLTDQDFEQ